MSLSLHLLLLISRGVCHDKVYEFHDISAAPMSSTFFASLLQQCGLAVFFDDCCNKLSTIATKFLCLLLCICCYRAMKCHDKVQLTLSNIFRNKVSNVATFFPFLTLIIFGWFVGTKFSMSRRSSFLLPLVLSRQYFLCRDILLVFPHEFLSSLVAT